MLFSAELLYSVVKERRCVSRDAPRGIDPPSHSPRRRLRPRREPDARSKPLFRRARGGDNRDRTGDLLLAKQALSQLSYIPTMLAQAVRERDRTTVAAGNWWA